MTETIQSESILNPILKNKKIAWGLIIIGVLLSIIENYLKMDFLIGSWHIVGYTFLLLPLMYMVYKKQIINPYTKWFIPFLLVMIGDMFYYNNEMTQNFLPIIFYLLVFMLYMTSMHTIHSLYQTIVIPNYKIGGLSYLKEFFKDLIVKDIDKKLYARVGTGLLITVPFFFIFALLLSSADSYFSAFFRELFRFNVPFEVHYIFTLPFFFLLYLLIFIYGFSNHKKRDYQQEPKGLDTLIVGIFLGAINLLFLSFVMMQIPFLSTGHIPNGVNIADFTREGFFQLLMVLGLVSLIFLFILRRYKGERTITFLLSGLLIQASIIGIVSLKKMYLYQSIMGATVLRYYVEWFYYFLLIVLIGGIIFIVKRYAFAKLLDIITILGITSLTLIVSLNIDAMVAKHNIEKFQSTPEKLDKNALRELSIDALPVISQAKINIKEKADYRGKEDIFYPWYIQQQRKNCDSFKTYHYGYCSILKKYGE